MNGRGGFGLLVIFTALFAANCSGRSDSHPAPSNHASGGAAAGTKSSGGAPTETGKGGSTGGAGGSTAGTSAGGRSSSGGRGGSAGNTGGASGSGARGGQAGTTGGDAGATGGDAGAMGGDAGSGGGPAGAAGASGEGGAGGAPNEFLPTDLGSRLVLWLDAGQGVSASNGDGVGESINQSSAHNDALQSAVASQPAFRSSGVNGLPAMTFNGQATFFQVADSATMRFGTGAFALFVVVRGAPATGVNAMIVQKSDAADPFAGPALLVNPNKPTSSTKVVAQVNGTNYALSPGAGVADTTPRLFAARRFAGSADTELEVRINGAPGSHIVLSTAINVNAPGRDLMIGHNGYNPSPGFQAYEGDISEICAVKGELTASELANLEGYLLDKYGLN